MEDKNFLLIVEQEINQKCFWYSTEDEILDEIKSLQKTSSKFEAFDLKVKKIYQINGFKFA